MNYRDKNAKKPKWLYSFDNHAPSGLGRGCRNRLYKGPEGPGLGREGAKKMKILLVNNHTRHVEQLNKALVGNDVEMQMYEPGIDFHTEGKDLVILSGGGGEGKEMYDKHKPTNKLWYEDEMNFALTTDKPVIGICMGLEVIAGAYGSALAEMPQKGVEGYDKVKTTLKGLTRFKKFNLRQFEAHDYCIKDISSKEFEILAESDTGIEMIRHKKRRIIATQFHPEFSGGTLKLSKLLGVI